MSKDAGAASPASSAAAEEAGTRLSSPAQADGDTGASAAAVLARNAGPVDGMDTFLSTMLAALRTGLCARADALTDEGRFSVESYEKGDRTLAACMAGFARARAYASDDGAHLATLCFVEAVVCLLAGNAKLAFSVALGDDEMMALSAHMLKVGIEGAQYCCTPRFGLQEFDHGVIAEVGGCKAQALRILSILRRDSINTLARLFAGHGEAGNARGGGCVRLRANLFAKVLL
jgi:hypothetical protein